MRSGQSAKAARKRDRRAPKARRQAPSSAVQQLHGALWKTYLPQDPLKGPKLPKLPKGPKEPQPSPSVPGLLDKYQGKVGRALLGIAVWNLVPKKEPPPGTVDATLANLLQTLLDLDVAQACRMRAAETGPQLPPYTDQAVIDFWYQSPGASNPAAATLEICVPADFNSVKQIVLTPSDWAAKLARSFFWSNVDAPDGKAVRAAPQRLWPIKADLHLPTENGSSPPCPIELAVQFFDGPLEARIRFQMLQNKLIASLHGEVTVKKEAGRPGAVRVTNHRVVQFAKAPWTEYADKTLMYWLQAETVAFALRS